MVFLTKTVSIDSAKRMAQRYIVVLLLVFVVMFPYNVLEGGAYTNQVAFSRKELKAEHKQSFGGMSPSLGGQISGTIHAEGVRNHAEIANVQTTTTTDTHRDIPVDMYRSIIIHGHQLNKP